MIDDDRAPRLPATSCDDRPSSRPSARCRWPSCSAACLEPRPSRRGPPSPRRPLGAASRATHGRASRHRRPTAWPRPAAIPVLSARGMHGGVVPLETGFRLESVDGTSASALAKALSVEPAFDFTTQADDGDRAVDPDPDRTAPPRLRLSVRPARHQRRAARDLGVPGEPAAPRGRHAAGGRVGRSPDAIPASRSPSTRTA